jgi:helicase-like protein
MLHDSLAPIDVLSDLHRRRSRPEIKVFAGSSVLERGLDGLQEASRVLLTLGPTDNPAREDQREGRIARIGSAFGTYEHHTFALDLPNERDRYGAGEDRYSGWR